MTIAAHGSTISTHPEMQTKPAKNPLISSSLILFI